MRRFLVAFALLLICMPAFAGRRGRNISINDDGDQCHSRNFQFDGKYGFVAEETIDGGNPRTFRVSTDSHPLSVRGGARGGYSIRVCKGAEYAEDLDDIHVTVVDGELRTSGPEDREWTVLFRVSAPNGGHVEIDARNGPVAIRSIDATINARIANGPLSLNDVGGRVDVTTKNGPISIDGGSGEMTVRATNGPLSVDLSGGRFDGNLEASTENGPLTVNVPKGYGSGVLVEALGRGPISCRAEGCGRWRQQMSDYDDDPPRRIELGSGPTNVRLSTVNGPVTIRDN
jgi:hypothetical protein